MRNLIVNYVIEKWSYFEPFILGNEYYTNIKNSYDYKIFMGKNAIYGSDIEIMAFSELYEVFVKIKSDNSQYNNLSFGNENYIVHLTLFFQEMI